VILARPAAEKAEKLKELFEGKPRSTSKRIVHSCQTSIMGQDCNKLTPEEHSSKEIEREIMRLQRKNSKDIRVLLLGMFLIELLLLHNQKN